MWKDEAGFCLEMENGRRLKRKKDKIDEDGVLWTAMGTAKGCGVKMSRWSVSERCKLRGPRDARCKNEDTIQQNDLCAMAELLCHRSNIIGSPAKRSKIRTRRIACW